MNNVVVKFPKIYKPLDDPWRYKVMYGGRAAARSWTIGRKLLLRGAQNKEFILCTRELQKSIKQSVHKLLKDQIIRLGLQNFYTVTETSIKGLNGTEFMFLGIKANPEEIRSTEGITICWIEEGHSLSESSWDIIDPTIRYESKQDDDRQWKSEIWISFNTRFKFDYLYEKFVVKRAPKNALVLFTSYKDNPFFPDVLREQMETMRDTDYEKYLNIWEGQLKKLAEGAIFGKQITKVSQDNRQTFIPVLSNCEVFTFWDLGKNDETAIWFVQLLGKEYRFIDYFEGTLEEVEYYTKLIKATGYNYGRHYLPHDAKQDRLGMGNKNLKQQFEAGGVRPTKVVERIQHKSTAIELARDVFSQCWFHKHKDELPEEECEGFIPWVSDDQMKTRALRVERGYDTLCNYRYKFKDDDNVYHERPHHDHASNGADAFMCFAQSHIYGATPSKQFKVKRAIRARPRSY